MFNPRQYAQQLLSNEEFLTSARRLDGELLRLEVWHALTEIAAEEVIGTVLETGEVPDLNQLTDDVLPLLLPHLHDASARTS